MAPIDTRKTVLVSGANGFVGSAVVTAFVDAGYIVHATVRSKAKGEAWLSTRSAAVQSAVRLFEVPDITKDGAFDAAIKGVDVFAHTASPADFQGTADEVIDTAINGTLSALRSAAGESRCKRVVLTSSIVAALLPTALEEGKQYSAADWNPITYQEAKASDSPAIWYFASKTLAEKAAWDFVTREAPQLALTTILPSLNYGLSDVATSTAALTLSLSMLWPIFNGSLKEIPPTFSWSLIDVRDVARIHLLAATMEEAKGKRYIAAAYTASNEEVAAAARKARPDKASLIPPTSAKQEVRPTYSLDATPLRTDLGMEFIPFEQCIADTVNYLWKLEDKA